ncbi:MAG: VCBS repeat-containing protein [Gemmataceae bacterium]
MAAAADIGGGPRITLYLNRNGVLEPTNNFFALDENFRGGLRIALADIDGDHHADLIVAGGPGAGPRVATYDGTTLTEFQTPQRLFDDFFAMDPDTRLGMFVAAGDLDGDGVAEIAVSSDFGGGPRILIFNGESLLHDAPVCVADFFAGDPNSRGGARIAIRDVSPSVEGIDLELIVGDGPTAGSSVRVYSGMAVMIGSASPLVTSELLPGYLGGVFVA